MGVHVWLQASAGDLVGRWGGALEITVALGGRRRGSPGRGSVTRSVRPVAVQEFQGLDGMVLNGVG